MLHGFVTRRIGAPLKGRTAALRVWYFVEVEQVTDRIRGAFADW